jgi:aldose 1-epimerase
MDAELVATGEMRPVAHTPLDFREATALNTRVRGLTPLPSSQWLDGYDNCFRVSPCTAGGLALCARVSAPESGRVMDVWSTEPTLQFYTGLLPYEALPGGPGKCGRTYFQQQGLCFEPQGYPNAPNCPVDSLSLASAVYAPGQSRAGSTVYRFSTQTER